MDRQKQNDFSPLKPEVSNQKLPAEAFPLQTLIALPLS